MSRHDCTGDSCGYCNRRINQAEDERYGLGFDSDADIAAEREFGR